MTRDPLDLVLQMARDWTDPAVVRDAPERVPYVIEQLIAHCEALRAALVHVRTTARDALAPAAPCPEFKPDHNGECLNCDEWGDDHLVAPKPSRRRRKPGAR